MWLTLNKKLLNFSLHPHPLHAKGHGAPKDFEVEVISQVFHHPALPGVVGASWSSYILHPWYILGRSKIWFLQKQGVQPIADFTQTRRFLGPTIPRCEMWDHSSWILLKIKIQPVDFANFQRVIPNQSKLGIQPNIPSIDCQSVIPNLHPPKLQDS